MVVAYKFNKEAIAGMFGCQGALSQIAPEPHRSTDVSPITRAEYSACAAESPVVASGLAAGASVTARAARPRSGSVR